MLQVFHMDVAKVNWDVAYVAIVFEACCKCFKDMLQAFVRNVSSVFRRMFQAFRFGCCICFTYICRKSMFGMF
jgi:hypothetical protein